MRTTYSQLMGIFLILPILVLHMACEDQKEKDPDMTIEVTGGTSPRFAWSFNKSLEDIADPSVGNVESIVVSQELVDGSWLKFWEIVDTAKVGFAFFDDYNPIESSVKYGNLPSGARMAHGPDPLVEGSVYHVSIMVEIDESYEGRDITTSSDHFGMSFRKEFSP